jgi:hypothetical protein
MPYLCGFESQITGSLSPWCGVFTDTELRQYEYSNDLRYYYGEGPGTGLESTMMLPFLSALIGLLQKGPSINGTSANGKPFVLPKLLMSFLNDGQMSELVTSIGVFDGQPPLSATQMDDNRKYIASRFVSMRGTIAFERMNCAVTTCTGAPTNATYLRLSAPLVPERARVLVLAEELRVLCAEQVQCHGQLGQELQCHHTRRADCGAGRELFHRSNESVDPDDPAVDLCSRWARIVCPALPPFILPGYLALG